MAWFSCGHNPPGKVRLFGAACLIVPNDAGAEAAQIIIVWQNCASVAWLEPVVPARRISQENLGLMGKKLLEILSCKIFLSVIHKPLYLLWRFDVVFHHRVGLKVKTEVVNSLGSHLY